MTHSFFSVKDIARDILSEVLANVVHSRARAQTIRAICGRIVHDLVSATSSAVCKSSSDDDTAAEEELEAEDDQTGYLEAKLTLSIFFDHGRNRVGVSAKT